MPPWPAVAGMYWNRPDPADTQGGPLWSAAPGAPGTKWQPLDPTQGRNSAFVDRLQDYGGHQVQRFLDLDWVKIVHTVTGGIFPQGDSKGALHEIQRPALPLSYGRARDYFMRQYGQVTEGRGKESLGSTLADYIWTEISLRAGTCTSPTHYKAIGNN